MARKSALRDQIYAAIRKLPADVDPVVAADVALEILVDSAWIFSRDCKRLPPKVMRELLRRRPTDATHVYLTLAVDPDEPDGQLAKHWARAIQGLADLETINRWQSKPKKEKTLALAHNAHLLPAIQGAAANGENVSNDMLAVLVADGSDESMDALIPHLQNDDRLDSLRMLHVHAKNTPRLRALFAELDRDAEKAGSPALRIARLVGLADAKLFWFTAAISMRVPANAIPAVQCHVTVDSRKAAWFEVSVAVIEGGSISGYTHFTHDSASDPLGIGRCDAAEVPAWLGKVGKKLRVTWERPVITSSIRGAKRDQIARWLLPEK
ncbi:MAG: hypothetical protein ABI867_38690 [Kofleriaceae bacterium]